MAESSSSASKHVPLAEQVKCRNFSALAIKNPLDVDKIVEYVSDGHSYLVKHEGRVPVSVTGAKARVFEEAEFIPQLIVQKNIASWRANPRSKYHEIVRDNDDETSERLIAQLWSNSTMLGTNLHRRAEGYLNGEDMPDDGQTDTVWPQLRKALEGFESAGAEPFRTELSLLWRDSSSNNALCAGQLDVLFKLGDEFVIGDFKCTDKDLSEDCIPFKGKRVSKGPMKGKLCNEFNKFSFQLSMYCVMLEQQCGIKVPEGNRLIIRAHPSLPEAEIVEMKCFDDEARSVLDALPSMFPEKYADREPASSAEPELKRPKNITS
jgi:hypothetical protein